MFRRRLPALLSAALVSVASARPALAQSCDATELAEVVASDAAANDTFGEAVALSGDFAVVGAPGDDDACEDDPLCNSGSAYVYRFDDPAWVEEAKLLPSDTAEDDLFGTAVGASGNRIVVGAPQCSGSLSDPCKRPGAAYVFRFDVPTSSWVEEAKLTASDGANGDRFGFSIDISDDVIIVGARFGDGIEVDGGAAYVYRLNAKTGQWEEEGKLIPSDAAFFFAEAVAVSGDVAVVGAHGDSLNPSNTLCFNGSAFVYRFDSAAGTWSEEAKLFASDADPTCIVEGNQLGTSVAVDGDLIVAGAEADEHAGSASGAAYAFAFDPRTRTWSEQKRFIAPDAAAFTFFGHAVSLRGDLALIGAPGRSFGKTRPGSAYLFRYFPKTGTWRNSPDATLQAADASSGNPDYFGGAVALDGDRAWIGARNDSRSRLSVAGAAFAFRGLAADCNGNGVIDLCDIADGRLGDCNRNGVGDSCEVADGVVDDCDANNVPDECDPDCNENGVPDPCDIAEGAPDCNGNGILDGCEGQVFSITEITASDPATGDLFGNAVDVDGEVAVVGARFDENRGAAYVYRYNGVAWVEEAKLVASDGGADHFGAAVAIQGDTVAVGAPFRFEMGSNQVGAVYIFERVGDTSVWEETDKLIASDAAAEDRFGSAVAFDSDLLVVGAPLRDCRVPPPPFDPPLPKNAGAAYVFRLDPADGMWHEEAILEVDEDCFTGRLGNDVAVDDGVIVLGTGSPGLTAAYVFRFEGTWTEEAVLLPFNSDHTGSFGNQVAIHGEWLAVGHAGARHTSGDPTGAVYMFRYAPEDEISGPWAPFVRLLPSDGAALDTFGAAMALRDDVLVVAAPSHNRPIEDAGALYPYRFDEKRKEWIEQDKITAPEAEPGDGMGAFGALAAGETVVAVGASGRDTNGDSSGAAYLMFGIVGDRQIAPPGCERCELAELRAPQGVEDDRLGHAVALDNGRVLVGAAEDDETCINNLPCNAGAAHVYREEAGGWVHEAKLTVADSSIAALIGWSVALQGDRAVLGALRQDGPGAAFVFRRKGHTWSADGELAPDDGEAGDEFGFDIALDGDVVVAGAPKKEDLGTRTGAVYVFRHGADAWAFEQKLMASDAGPGRAFGQAVALHGNELIVGSPEDDHSGAINPGSVYVFGYDSDTGSWEEVDKLFAPDPAGSDAFGRAVALDGDYLLIGAPLDQPTGVVGAGSVYVFRRGSDGWTFQTKLMPGTTAGRDDEFGHDVALRGNLAAIGAHMSPLAGTVAGQGMIIGVAYVFERRVSGWRALSRFAADDTGGSDEFGTSVAVEPGRVVIGAPRHTHDVPVAGAAYVMAVGGPDCNADGVPNACEPDADTDTVPDGCDLCPNTIPTAPVDAAGCPPHVPADFDVDGDVDHRDYEILHACLSGPAVPDDPGCKGPDLDGDADADLLDFDRFQRCFSGFGILADPSCGG